MLEQTVPVPLQEQEVGPPLGGGPGRPQVRAWRNPGEDVPKGIQFPAPLDEDPGPDDVGPMLVGRERDCLIEGPYGLGETTLAWIRESTEASALAAGHAEQVPYRDTGLFFSDWTPEDRLRAYGVFGGVPYYLNLCDPGATLAANVRDLVLAMGAPLADASSRFG